MSLLIAEVDRTIKSERESHVWSLTLPSIIVYWVKLIGWPKERERGSKTPAAHTSVCMLHSIKLAWLQY